MWSPKILLLTLVIDVALCPFLAGQQHSRRPISHVRPYTSVDDILNREAGDSDPHGIHQYSEDLTGVLVPERAGEDYIESLANHLTRAEQMARGGKGKLIPEAEIVRVFNNLMRQVGAPPSFKTDEATVRRFRTYAVDVPSLPALLSANRNGAYCNPGEAVYLVYLLLSYNGALPDRILDDEAALRRTEGLGLGVGGRPPMSFAAVTDGRQDENADWFLSAYSSRHRRHATIKLFNKLANAFSF
jgi:hypothetical protein